MKNKISIVIPNWNGVYLMEKHLPQVIARSTGAQIVIADDMSTDGSVEWIQEKYPHIVVVRGKTREGFAANVNRGVAVAQGDIVILLNTDVEPERGFLTSLLSHFEDSEVFAVGCLEKSWENGKAILRGRGIATWEKGYYMHNRGEVNKKDTAWVSGGSGAFRKSMWDRLGGMDTLYNPFYWEDIDLSYRAKKAGYKTLFDPNSIVNHYHEEGKIKRSFTPIDVKRIVYRNQFIFIWKNCSDIKILISHFVWTPIRICQTLMKGDILMIQGYCMALLLIIKILRHRFIQSRTWKLRDTECV